MPVHRVVIRAHHLVPVSRWMAAEKPVPRGPLPFSVARRGGGDPLDATAAAPAPKTTSALTSVAAVRTDTEGRDILLDRRALIRFGVVIVAKYGVLSAPHVHSA